MSFVGFDAIQAEEVTFVGEGLPKPAGLFDAAKVADEAPSRPLIRASAPPPAPDKFKRLCDEFNKRHTTPPPLAELKRIASLPQHLEGGEANPAWLESRLHKVTGSAIGALLPGVNPYEDCTSKLASLVWPEWNPFRGNDATRYGNRNEDNAQAAFALAIGVSEARIENPGLVICADKGRGHLAMSPDGVLHTDRGMELVEYKAPWGSRFLEEEEDVLRKGSLYPRKPITGAACGVVPIPSYYHSQVQHGMSVLSSLGTPITRTHFVVWAPAACTGPPRVIARNPESRTVITPKGTVQITEVERDPKYIEWMYEHVDRAWQSYVAACVWRDCKCLNEPDLRPSLDVE